MDNKTRPRFNVLSPSMKTIYLLIAVVLACLFLHHVASVTPREGEQRILKIIGDDAEAADAVLPIEPE